jgi:hypothetical protein
MFTVAEIMLPSSPLAAASALAATYVVCFIVGGGLLAISTIFGHHTDTDVDADLDVDFDADVDVGADLDASADLDVDADPDAVHIGHAAEGISLATWFSIRFLVYFTATFGAVGTILTYMSSASAGAVLAASVAAGLVVGQAVHQALRYLKRTSGDSAATVRDYLNRSGRVTIAIEKGHRGEVALQVRGRERFVAATAKRPDTEFSVGDRVAVVTFADGQAEVISQREFDFIHEHERGA